MARKLRTKTGQAIYARRKVIPEPVFGQMKTLQGAGQLLLRGHHAARGEWLLHATAHNIRKLAAHRDRLPPKRFRGSTSALIHDAGQALRRLASTLTLAPATP